MEVHYFKRPQHYGLFNYYRVVGGPGKNKQGYQEMISFLADTPLIVVERNEDSNGLTGTWCTHEVGIPITKEEWDEAYKLATEGDFDIK